jgi:purine-nucleoside phosphorylase
LYEYSITNRGESLEENVGQEVPMSEFVTLEQINIAARTIRSRIAIEPRVGLVLGSGLGRLAASVRDADYIDYNTIPEWPVSTVMGHTGRLVVGSLEGQPVFVMQGRAHYYEGYPISRVTLPIRVMHQLGINTLIITNAAGAVNPDFEPGDLMMITDHLNLLGMAGANPLRGPNLDSFGPRFPDMSQAYDREYHEIGRQIASGAGMQLHEGVYVGLLGPSFETPADLRFLRMVGVDAVGMSTVPEVTVARHSGMRVFGVSGISNKANLDGNTITTHEEVMEAGQVLVPKLEFLVREFLKKI